MRALAIATSLLTCLLGFAQEPRAQAAKTEALNKTSTTAKRKLTTDQKRAMQLLESAEGASAGLDPTSRTIALRELARAYQSNDKAKAVGLLERAYEAARGLPPGPADNPEIDQTKRQLEESVLRQLVLLAPERVDKQIEEIPAELRSEVLGALLPYYESTMQIGRAFELISQLAAQTEMPYEVAMDLMDTLPADQSDRVQELFVDSFTSYQNHDHQGFRTAGDFSEMIGKFYGKVPDNLIVAAIDEVLSQSKKADDDMNKVGMSLNVGVATGKGAAQFKSRYDYRLFELLPLLQRLDSARAQLLIKDRQGVSTFLVKYPEGLNSLGATGASSISIGSGSGSGAASSDMTSMLEAQRSSAIVADAEKHPRDALANAALLSPASALQAYLGIARANLKKDTSSARAALGKAEDLIPQVSSFEQIMFATDGPKLYLQMGDAASALQAVHKGMNTAKALYKGDIDANDPNTAPKAFWPSNNLWQQALGVATKINSVDAMAYLDEIPDDGIRVFSQIAMARTLLGVPSDGMYVVNARKQGGYKGSVSPSEN